ncbi:sensor histidine kinase [Microbacterium neungamense]|uniref:sensor histidine kinase n=1 Tax=Microbacterium neungamense TaxID=2810535 RepID=UPI00217F011C|nr:ATP-binding protein [Microbacterium neungamense]UWF76897.1 ATP-binding protein [Microbacterium neungamense]
MAAEAGSIREAWSRIPSPGVNGGEFERFTGERMERILGIVTAIGSTALGAQALFAAITRLPEADPARIAMMIMVFGPLLAMILACITGRWARQACGTFAVVYVLALLLWPQVVNPAVRTPDTQPWIFFLVNIGVAAAMIAFPVVLQFAWAIAVPFVYGFVRLVQGEFSQSFWISTAFDVSFTLILGMVIVSLAWMFRQVAGGVDEVRSQTVSAYARAAAATAAEEERVSLAALMHDSVLAALIAAERAESDRERGLAAGMAREALTRLANTEASIAQEGNEQPIAGVQVVAELRRALSELGADAVVEERGVPAAIPERVARAIVLAARQAIGNAMTHAGGRGLHVVVEAARPDAMSVTVLDSGPGFDVDAIGADRLGIRASILARMAAIAGTADVRSGPGGTTVTLSWEAA